jgi:oligopeptide/dipeptide ABC transporter ATP-binding protein
MTSLLEEESQEARRINSSSVYVSLLIVSGIGLGFSFLVSNLGYFLIGIRVIDTMYLPLAVMVTLFFPFYIIVRKKNNRENVFLKVKKSRKIFLIRVLFVIGISWITFLLFLSISLLNIPLYDFIPGDPQNPHYDPFLLGFEWAFVTVIINVVLTKIIILLRPSGKQPPKILVKKATTVSSLIAFGIWSIQLIIVELYLGRLFGIDLSFGGILIGVGIFFIILALAIFIKAPGLLPLKTILMIVFLLIGGSLSIVLGIFHLGTRYIQDIRILFAVVSLIYVVSFFISMHYIFIPRDREEKMKLIQEFIKEEELGVEKVQEQEVILNVQDLTTRFFTEEGVVHAVEGISFKVYKGEVLGLVGETGCGKSVTALSIVQLIQAPGRILNGKVEFGGEDLLEKSEIEILSYRGNDITMIFQDPLNSLNPVFTVGKQISEVYLLHKKKELTAESHKKKGQSIYAVAREWSEQLLRDLNIPSPENILDRYPHELSGGMRQRIQIAMGIACSPKLLIADEPTTALDVTVQNQILKLMKELKQKYNTSILFITHDLGIISKMCNRVAVMYSGSIVEYGTTQIIFKNPYHPYTRGLLSAVPIEGKEEELLVIPGTVPNLIYPPSGCRFHPRCNYCFEPCDSIIPEQIETVPSYFVACHLYDPKYKDLAQNAIKNTENPTPIKQEVN